MTVLPKPIASLVLALAAFGAGAAHAGWGAMYVDTRGGADPAVGWSWEQRSPAAAENRAAWECERRAGRPCRHLGTFNGQCNAVVHGWRDGRSFFSAYQTAYRDVAQRKALAMCADAGDAQCRVIAAACS